MVAAAVICGVTLVFRGLSHREFSAARRTRLVVFGLALVFGAYFSPDILALFLGAPGVTSPGGAAIARYIREDDGVRFIVVERSGVTRRYEIGGDGAPPPRVFWIGESLIGVDYEDRPDVVVDEGKWPERDAYLRAPSEDELALFDEAEGSVASETPSDSE